MSFILRNFKSIRQTPNYNGSEKYTLLHLDARAWDRVPDTVLLYPASGDKPLEECVRPLQLQPSVLVSGATSPRGSLRSSRLRGPVGTIYVSATRIRS
jgi:hypothetical protein